MPESHDLYKIFIGEYPWHPSSTDYLVDWSDSASRGKQEPPVPLLVTAAQYICEGNVRDCSVDDAVSGLIPSSKVISDLGLTWDGTYFRYVDKDGHLVAFDPSASEAGPMTLLISEPYLRSHLKQEGLALVWTVLGEKLIYSMSNDRIGRLEISGAYSLLDGPPQAINLTTRFLPY
jgi:hypothetical protein